MKNITKIYFLLLALIFGVVLQSCSDDVNEANEPPHISAIEPAKASPGDIITIYGSNLAYNPAEGIVRINGLSIPYTETIKWNNAFIRLHLPLTAKSGNVFIVIGKDTSNSLSYEIEDKPAIELLAIAAGEFMMGSGQGFGYEQPLHKVSISTDFQMSKYEITQKIWQLVMNDNPSSVKSANLPVMNITWNDAVEFCNRLSKLYGLDTAYIVKNNKIELSAASTGFRLPTEAEWEYACRAGTKSDFPGSGKIDEMGWYNANSAYNPHPVGTKKANNWGLFDMNGNVWEWCWDWYGSDYYSVSPTTDPQGPATGKRHVLRGGSCSDGATFARSSNRTFPAKDFTHCGLRIVKNK